VVSGDHRRVVSGGIEADPPLPPAPGGERSRRALLARGGALGLAALVAGCTSKVKQPSNVPLNKHTPGAERDVDILNGLLSLEYRSIAAYTACIPLVPKPVPPPKNQAPQTPPPSTPSKKPPPPLRLMVPLAYTAFQQFLSQELAHVTELNGFIGQVGGHPVKPAVSYDLGHPKTKLDVLMLLHRIEESLQAAYLHAVGLLTPQELRGAAAAIFANHAQHSSVLRLQLGLAPIPSAFVSRPE
jgi:ferritin-like protein